MAGPPHDLPLVRIPDRRLQGTRGRHAAGLGLAFLCVLSAPGVAGVRRGDRVGFGVAIVEVAMFGFIGRIVDLAKALRDPATPAGRRATYQQAYDRIAGYLYSAGAKAAGLVLTG